MLLGGERLHRVRQRRQAPGAFDDVAGQNVAQHNGPVLAGCRIDAHESLSGRQVVQGAVRHELLSQGRRLLRVAGPASGGKPFRQGKGIDRIGMIGDVHPPGLVEFIVTGQVGAQRGSRSFVGFQFRDHSIQFRAEAAVQEVGVRGFLAAPVVHPLASHDDPVHGQFAGALDAPGFLDDAQQFPQGVGVLGRRQFPLDARAPGPLEGTDDLPQPGLRGTELVDPFDPGDLSVGDSPDGPERRRQHRGVRDDPPVLVQYQTDAGTPARGAFAVFGFLPRDLA